MYWPITQTSKETNWWIFETILSFSIFFLPNTVSQNIDNCSVAFSLLLSIYTSKPSRFSTARAQSNPRSLTCAVIVVVGFFFQIIFAVFCFSSSQLNQTICISLSQWVKRIFYEAQLDCYALAMTTVLLSVTPVHPYVTPTVRPLSKTNSFDQNFMKFGHIV